MEYKTISIRPFIGARDFEVSRNFYQDLGFEEIILAHNMSLFQTGQLGFYLQDAYLQDWVDNTMIFLEVEDLDGFWDRLLNLGLTKKYEQVKLIPIREYEWGREFFVHDPSGVLWHIGSFKNSS
ncbi:glyoxalase [soil metagenome]